MISMQAENHLIAWVKSAAGTLLDKCPINYHRSFATRTF